LRSFYTPIIYRNKNQTKVLTNNQKSSDNNLYARGAKELKTKNTQSIGAPIDHP